MKTINKRFVEMVACGYREGRQMSNLDFFEMLNPVDVSEFKVMDWTPFPASVATVALSDKETYFKYKILLMYVPNLGYRYICVYWCHRKWTVRCIYENLFDVLNTLYDNIF